MLESDDYICTLEFINSPYSALNYVQFTVHSYDINSYNNIRSHIELRVCDLDGKAKLFEEWQRKIYFEYYKCDSAYLNTDAHLLLYDKKNAKLIRSFKINCIHPDGIEYDNHDNITGVEFTAKSIVIEDLTEKEKKMKDEPELNSVLDKAQPYVKLISKLDELEEYVDKNGLPSHFQSVGKEFVESLHRYNSILKSKCVDLIKGIYN